MPEEGPHWGRTVLPDMLGLASAHPHLSDCPSLPGRVVPSTEVHHLPLPRSFPCRDTKPRSKDLAGGHVLPGAGLSAGVLGPAVTNTSVCQSIKGTAAATGDSC